jgi:23S rRNA (cytosine1962-C5)-methyltransferase
MDPPVYGRGPSGELWKLEDRLYELLEACVAILSPQPLFILLNMYTAGISPVAAANVLRLAAGGIKTPGSVRCREIGLKTGGGIILPCGLYARWEANA